MAKCEHCGEDHTLDLDRRLVECHKVAKRISMDLVNSYDPADAMLILATAAAALTVNAGPQNGVGERAKSFMDAYIDIITTNPRQGG